MRSTVFFFTCILSSFSEFFSSLCFNSSNTCTRARRTLVVPDWLIRGSLWHTLCLVFPYLRVGDTHLLHVCRQLVDVTAELFNLLRERLQRLLLLELGIALRLVSNGNCAGYWRRVLFVTHTLRDTKTSSFSTTSV